MRDGHWHHLAVVYGESAVQLLVDGVVQLSAAALSPASYSSLRVGGSDEAHSVGVRATFSDLQLWRTELGQQQLRQAMDREVGFSVIPHSSRLVSWSAASGVDASAGSQIGTSGSLEDEWARGASSSERIVYWRRRSQQHASHQHVRPMKHGAQGVQFRCSGGPAQHQCMGLALSLIHI